MSKIIVNSNIKTQITNNCVIVYNGNTKEMINVEFKEKQSLKERSIDLFKTDYNNLPRLTKFKIIP